MPDNINTELKTVIEDNDTDRLYTKEQKNRDILLSKFQNIARYMDTEMDDNDNKLVLKNLSDLIIDDYDLSKLNEDRFNFYMELQKILRKDPRILNMIMNLNTRIKIKKKKERKILNQLIKVLKKLKQGSEDNEQQGSEDNKNKKETIIDALQNVLLKNYNLSPSTDNDTNDTNNTKNSNFDAKQLYDFLTKKQSGGDNDLKNEIYDLVEDKKPETKTKDSDEDNKNSKESIIEKANKLYKSIKKQPFTQEDEDKLRGNLALHYGMNNLENLTQKILNNDGNNSNNGADKFERNKNSMEEFIDDYYKAHSQPDKSRVAASLQKALDKFEASPTNFLESIKITREDRLIFIFVTFFIRYITILMVQWCIDINIIKDFYQGFLLYAVIYNIIFWFVVMLVNINNITPVSYMNTETSIGGLQNMFYYFYMGINGISRLLTHCVLIILLLLIPIILNIHHKNEDATDEDINALSYEDRKKLTKTLSLFTIFIWVLTSMIAIKY
jgi:hypothetical protein